MLRMLFWITKKYIQNKPKKKKKRAFVEVHFCGRYQLADVWDELFVGNHIVVNDLVETGVRQRMDL